MDKSIKELLNFEEIINIDETTKFCIFKRNEGGGMGSISFGIVECEYKDNVNFWAMKNIKIDEKTDENKERFENEAKLWIKLKHPNIVRAFYYKIIREVPRIFMEPIISDDNLITLDDFIKKNLDLKTILNWSIQFCHGMIYANNNGVAVHRDIKPQNILIKDNILKITDFGISSSDCIDIKDNNLSGTLEFKAPETFKGVADTRSDIYSWGMVMYKMLKKNLFIHDYVVTKDIGNTAEKYELLHNKGFIFGLQSPLKHIVLKCLEKNPQERYADFTELLEDLQSLFLKLFNKKEMYSPAIKEFDETELTFLLFSCIELKDDDLNTYLDKYANNVNMYSVLGTISQRKGDENKSIEYFNKAIDKFPNEFGIHYDYTTSLSEMNKYEESKKQFQRAMELNPNDKSCHVNYGILLMKIGEYDSAVNEFKNVIKIDPSFFKAKLNLMFCFIKMNEFNKSDEIYKDIRDDDEFTKEHEISRAIYTMYQDFFKAEKIFNDLEKQFPNDWRLLAEIGNFYYIYKDFVRAEDYYIKFLDICPNVKKSIPYKVQILRELSEIAFNKDNFDESLNYINDSLSCDDSLNTRLDKLLLLEQLSKLDNNYEFELEENIKSFKLEFPNFVQDAKDKCTVLLTENDDEFYSILKIILIFEPDFDYRDYYDIC